MKLTTRHVKSGDEDPSAGSQLAADWSWADPAGRAAAFAAFRAAISSKLAATAPVSVTGGPSGRYAVPYRSDGRLVVAVTNDFSWVQITKRRMPGDPPLPPTNKRAPPAAGIRVTWRKGHGLPEQWDWFPFPRLFAFEAVEKKTLPIERLSGGYRVTLPAFDFMALLVVGNGSRPPMLPHETSARPASGRVSSSRMSIVVDFPAPFGPSSATVSPAPIDTSIPQTTCMTSRVFAICHEPIVRACRCGR